MKHSTSQLSKPILKIKITWSWCPSNSLTLSDSEQLCNYFQPQKLTDALDILNYIFTGIFFIEFILKIFGYGFYGYIKDSFNLFDGTIVIIR